MNTSDIRPLPYWEFLPRLLVSEDVFLLWPDIDIFFLFLCVNQDGSTKRNTIMQERNYNADDCIDNPKSVFTVLTPKEKEFLKQNYTCAFYKKGEIIFKEGDKPMGLMILAEGKVKIFKTHWYPFMISPATFLLETKRPMWTKITPLDSCEHQR